MKTLQMSLGICLFVLIFSANVHSANCNPGDQFWLSKNKLFYGKKELSDEMSPVILKPSKACMKLFPFCHFTAVFAKNKKKVFYKDQEVKGADPASFEYVCDDFGHDKKKIFRQTKKFSQSDARNFELDPVLTIYKTSKRVYNREGKEIEGADPATIEKIEYKNHQLIDYVKDKHSVYHLWGMKLKLRVKDLKVFGLEYLGDKKNVYFRTRLIAGADPETFQVTDSEMHLSEDKNNFYLEDRVKKSKLNSETVH